MAASEEVTKLTFWHDEGRHASTERIQHSVVDEIVARSRAIGEVVAVASEVDVCAEAHLDGLLAIAIKFDVVLHGRRVSEGEYAAKYEPDG